MLLCGGYGLVLRHRHLERVGARTLMPLVPVRSTEDVDLLLGEHIITNTEQTTRLKDAFVTLGYEAAQGARYFQFIRQISLGGQARQLKFDLLAPPPHQRQKVKINGPRIRPHGARHIHARLTPEAFSAHEYPLSVTVGEDGAGVSVLVVHPFTHMIMKLYALRDRLDEAKTNYGRRHALDLYRLLAMTTEGDWSVAEELVNKYNDEPTFIEAQHLVSTLFAPLDGLGRLRLTEAAKQGGIEVDMERAVEDLLAWFALAPLKT